VQLQSVTTQMEQRAKPGVGVGQLVWGQLVWEDCHVAASDHLQLVLQRAQPVVVMATHLLQLALQLPHPPAPVLLAPTPACCHD